MYPLAHLGIALTATRLGGYAGYATAAVIRGQSNGKKISDRAAAWISRSLDARFLLLGAVLPDIIDKPWGLLLMKPSIASGHFLCHTLLFAFILFAIAVISRGRTKKAMFALAIGTSFHLLLDYSWQDPHTLFWPLLGWQFDRGTSGSFMQASQDAVKWLVTSPDFVWGEIVGGLLLLVTFGRLNEEGWRRFIKSGQL